MKKQKIGQNFWLIGKKVVPLHSQKEKICTGA
jgi:hypothetical protein